MLTRRDWFHRTAVLAGSVVAAPDLWRVHGALPADPEVLRLHYNENAYGASPRALAAAQAAVQYGHEYPDSSDDLAAAIGASLSVPADHVLVGPGSYALLSAAAVVYRSAGSTIVMERPTYYALPTYAEHLGARLVRAPLDAEMRADLAGLTQRIDDTTRLLYLCSPQYPTGTITPGDQLAAFLRSTAARVPVLVDEAYAEYVTDARFGSMIPLVRDGANVIVTRTFSKIYGLAGYRIGYAVARPDLLEKLKPYAMDGALSRVALAVAAAALGDQSFAQTVRTRNADVRTYMIDQLTAMQVRHIPSHGNSLFIDVGRSGKDVRTALRARGILVGADYQPFETWIRVTVGTGSQIRRFLPELQRVLHAV